MPRSRSTLLHPILPFIFDGNHKDIKITHLFGRLPSKIHLIPAARFLLGMPAGAVRALGGLDSEIKAGPESDLETIIETLGEERGWGEIGACCGWRPFHTKVPD